MHGRDDDDHDPLRGYPRIRKLLEQVDRQPEPTLEELMRDSDVVNPLTRRNYLAKIH